MSTSAGPNIVEDGLVLSLDAANFKSFRGEPTTNLISSSGIDVSVYSPYNPMKFERVVEPEADSGFALEMTIEDINVNNSSRSRFGEATNIPTSGFAFVSIYARFVEGEPANIRPRVYTGLVWGILNPLDGGSIYLTSEYRRFGAYLEFGTNSGGPNPGFSMTLENSNKQVGQKTRWHSPQVELKEYATPFVNGTRGNTVETGGGWADLSGIGNNGELVNGVSYNDDNGGSLVFDGVDDTTDFGNVLQLGTESRTYCFWYKQGSTSFSTIVSLLSKTDNGATQYRQSIGFQTNGNFRVILRAQSNANYDMDTVNPKNDTDWHYLSWVINRNSSQFLYQDGILLNSKDISAISNQNFQLNRLFRIGSYNSTSNEPILFFNGYIASVSIYNKPLTIEEIKQNFNALRGRYGI